MRPATCKLFPYTTLFRSNKISKRIRCDGVIISNKLVMTMKKCLTRTKCKILVSPTDIELVVGGVVELASAHAKNLVTSISSLEIPTQSLSLPIIVLKVEE